MSAPRLDAFLVRLYTDAETRRQFVADPRVEALAAGLAPAEVEALAGIDRVGLELASRSFERKRADAARRRPARERWLAFLRRAL